MLRVLGYAHAPRILFLFTFLPLGIGWGVAIVAFVWSVVAGIVAIRQALDFSTPRAVLTVLLGALVAHAAYWLATQLHTLIFGAAGG